jgi:hypothetical protein
MMHVIASDLGEIGKTGGIQLSNECLLLICCRCSNVKQSAQFSIANRGHGHWQDGMLFAIIREGMAGDNHRGQHGAPA